MKKKQTLQTVLHLIVWYAGPGQNNNANFDTDVEAGGASEDDNQVIMSILIIMIISDEYQEVRGSLTISLNTDIFSFFVRCKKTNSMKEIRNVLPP